MTAEEWYRTHPDEVAKTLMSFAEWSRRRGLACLRALAESEKPVVTVVKRDSVPVNSAPVPESNPHRRVFRWVRPAKVVVPEPESRTRRRFKAGEGYEPAKLRVAWMLGDPCAYCGGVADTWDHLDSRKRGGDHSDANLARVCHPCNHEKTSRILLLFLAIRAQRKAASIWKRLPDSKLYLKRQR